MQAGEGGGASSTTGDMFNMRGFNAANSLFVDNVRDDGLISRDVFNLEQVEVFLGPTGTDVGRGNAAGYVNMSTKITDAGCRVLGIVSAGSQETVRVTADLNQPLRSERRAAGSRRAPSGSTCSGRTAAWPGRDFAENGRKSIAPSLALGSTPTPGSIAARASSRDQENLPDYGVPAAAWAEPLTPGAIQASRPVAQSNYYGSPDVDYDEANSGERDRARRARPDAGMDAAQPDPLQRDRRDAAITTIQSPTSVESRPPKW